MPTPRFSFNLDVSDFSPRPPRMTSGRFWGTCIKQTPSPVHRPKTCLVQMRHTSIAGLPCYKLPELAVALRRQGSIGASRQLDCLVVSLHSNRCHRNVSNSSNNLVASSSSFRAVAFVFPRLDVGGEPVRQAFLLLIAFLATLENVSCNLHYAFFLLSLLADLRDHRLGILESFLLAV